MPLFKEEVVRMNDQNIAALHYLKVPYRQWQYLTIFEERRCLLELTDLQAETVSLQMDGLNHLLMKQRTFTEECWRVAEELLADYAEVLGFGLCGKSKQQMNLRRLSNGSSACVVIDAHTSLLSLTAISLFLQKQETLDNVSCSINKQKLDQELENLTVMQSELEKQWVTRFQSHDSKLSKWQLSARELPVVRGIYLDDARDGYETSLSTQRFDSDVYGYAEFLEYIMPFTDTGSEYSHKPM